MEPVPAPNPNCSLVRPDAAVPLAAGAQQKMDYSELSAAEAARLIREGKITSRGSGRRALLEADRRRVQACTPSLR